MLAKSQYILGRKYRLIAPLGKGGMARVWLASELTFNKRLVAIKEPLASLDTDQGREVLRRFEQEISLSAAMLEAGVPNVVPAYTTERVDGIPLLVSRYMAGGSLAEKLERAGGKLSADDAVAIAKRVLVALSHLHGLPETPIHRDIKPSNILFDDHDQAFLADFGVAQIGGAHGQTRMAGLEHPATLQYAAPEQLSSTRPVTPAADLYALGCVLYETLTGARYAQGQDRDVSSALADCDAAYLAPVLERALAPKVRDRYQSAEAMLADLTRCWENQGAASSASQPASSTVATQEAPQQGHSDDLTVPQLDGPYHNPPAPERQSTPATDNTQRRAWPFAVGAAAIVAAIALGWHAVAMSRTQSPVIASPTATARPTHTAAAAVATAEPTLSRTPLPSPTATTAPSPTDAPEATAPAPSPEAQDTEPIYSAEFEQPDMWDTGSGDGFRIFVADSALRMEFDAAHRTRWSNAHESFGDVWIGAKACQIAGPDNNGYGLQFRHIDDDNFYLFMVSGDGFYQVSKRVDGEWQELIKWTPSEGIHQGNTCNFLIVGAVGDTFTLGVNETILAQVRDSSFAAGDIGLIAQSLDEPGVVVAFDAVAVFEPQER
jgi:serine/threonine protein kinase